MESLRQWCNRNPKETSSRRRPNPKKDQAFQASTTPKPCVYCDAEDHKPAECKKVGDMKQRRKILSDKRLCFNCTGIKHQAKECKSTRTCRQCGEKHHTSICVKKPERDQLLVTTGECAVVYSVVVVLVDGIKCRALLDTGSASSYASATLIENLNKKPVRTEHKQIEMMVCSTTQKINSYEATISSVDEKFTMTTVLSKVDKGVLLTIPIKSKI